MSPDPSVALFSDLDNSTTLELRSYVLTDVDELAECYPLCDHQFVQRSKGPFRAELRLVLVPGCHAMWLRLNQAVSGLTMPSVPRYILSPVTPTNAEWRRRGRFLREGQVELVPPGLPQDFVSTTETEATEISIDASVLHDAVGILIRKDADDVLDHCFALTPTPTAYSAFSEGLRRAIDWSFDNSRSLEQQGGDELIRSHLVSLVCDVLDASKPGEDGFERWESRREVVDEAVDYMNINISRPLTTLELSRTLCVSRRTLFYAFQEVTGMAPMTYLKHLRLNRARAQLKASDPAETTVRQVAAQWSFQHAGQFAADYAKFFGELPSATLARCRRQVLLTTLRGTAGQTQAEEGSAQPGGRTPRDALMGEAELCSHEA